MVTYTFYAINGPIVQQARPRIRTLRRGAGGGDRPEDIMSALGAGRVGRHHFERILGARIESSREDVTMKAGLDALYTRRDPEEAAAQFRKLLEWNPNHYGATFQLAWALDQGGKRGEARPLWEKALKMAEASHEKVTAAAARARLAEQP